MVELVEGDNGKRDFQGMIIGVEDIAAEGKFPPQYKLTIKPDNPEWKDCYIWAGIPSTATPEKVPKKSFLGYILKILEQNHVDVSGTHSEIIHALESRKFLFKDILPMLEGEAITKKEKLVMYELVE